jgi:dynein light intermediate chain 2
MLQSHSSKNSVLDSSTQSLNHDIWSLAKAKGKTSDGKRCSKNKLSRGGGEEANDFFKKTVKAVESALIFVGNKGSGKSSLILRFLERGTYFFIPINRPFETEKLISNFAYQDENPSPTVALEYTFGRKSRPMSNLKDVVHIWELGGSFILSFNTPLTQFGLAGGTLLSELVDVSLNESNVHLASFIVSLDLSKV